MSQKNRIFDLYIQNGLDKPIVLHRRGWDYFFVLLGCLMFIVILIFTLVASTTSIFDKFIAVIGLIFFGFGVFVSLYFLRLHKRIIFDKDGFYSARYNIKIPWQEIKSAKIAEMDFYFLRAKWLGIEVCDAEKLYKGMSWVGHFTKILHRNVLIQIIILLMSLSDVLDLPDTILVFMDIKKFDFWWTFNEFPVINILEVKYIIDIESRRLMG